MKRHYRYQYDEVYGFMKNTVHTPYRGNEPFIFVSYSHIRIDDAMDIICKMQSDGFRVWYDEGIDPGSEFSDDIASQVKSCEVFIALLSNEYLASSFCIDELSYARTKGKKILMIYLENIQLPDGLEMRVGRFQAIHRYKYIDNADFYKKLYSSHGLIACKAEDELHLYNINANNTANGSLSADINMVLSDQADNIDVPYNQDNLESLFRLIFVIDTSGSMQGEWIENLNAGLQLVKASLAKKYGANLAIDILQFDSDVCWKTMDDLPLKARGATMFGAALCALIEYGKNIPENCLCACVFIGDGVPSDEYTYYSMLLRCETWFKRAAISGIAVCNKYIYKIYKSIFIEDTNSLYYIDYKIVNTLPSVINKVTASTIDTAIRRAEAEKQKRKNNGPNIIYTDSDTKYRVSEKQEDYENEGFDLGEMLSDEEIEKELDDIWNETLNNIDNADN